MSSRKNDHKKKKTYKFQTYEYAGNPKPQQGLTNVVHRNVQINQLPDGRIRVAKSSITAQAHHDANEGTNAMEKSHADACSEAVVGFESGDASLRAAFTEYLGELPEIPGPKRKRGPGVRG